MGYKKAKTLNNCEISFRMSDRFWKMLDADTSNSKEGIYD